MGVSQNGGSAFSFLKGYQKETIHVDVLLISLHQNQSTCSVFAETILACASRSGIQENDEIHTFSSDHEVGLVVFQINTPNPPPPPPKYIPHIFPGRLLPTAAFFPPPPRGWWHALGPGLPSLLPRLVGGIRTQVGCLSGLFRCGGGGGGVGKRKTGAPCRNMFCC